MWFIFNRHNKWLGYILGEESYATLASSNSCYANQPNLGVNHSTMALTFR